VPVDVLPEVRALIGSTITDLRAEIDASSAAERVRDGFEVAIVGGPNAGKSTLMNRISGRDVSLTSDLPGTTRDILELRLDLHGLPVTFLDTAGLREAGEVVERLGIERALERARQADLRVFLLGGLEDGRQWLTPSQDDLLVTGKADLLSDRRTELQVSGRTGAGVSELLAEISVRLKARVAVPSTLIRERHRQASSRAVLALDAALEEAGGLRVEFAAEHLRDAIRALDGLIGRVDVEMLLGEIFASFCIGK
jgi:tRNA modification GTPase